jgi:hypothetical protein
MMDQLFNSVLARTAMQGNYLAQPRWGIVTSYDATTHMAKVSIQPEAIDTGWIQILCGNTGTTGFWWAPTPGQMAFVAPQEGSAQNYVVIGLAFNKVHSVPPVGSTIGGGAEPLKPGEVAIVWDGGQLRTSPGKLYVKADMEIEGKLTVSEDILGQQNITAEQQVKDFHNTLDDLRQHHNSHVHAGVTSGSSNTAPPTVQD